MLLLELSFTYDTTSRVLLRDPGSGGLLLQGVTSDELPGDLSPEGGMLRELHKYARRTYSRVPENLSEFQQSLACHYDAYMKTEAIDPYLAPLLHSISVTVESYEHGCSIIRGGGKTSIRLYPDREVSTGWIWKDNIREVTVIHKE